MQQNTETERLQGSGHMGDASSLLSLNSVNEATRTSCGAQCALSSGGFGVGNVHLASTSTSCQTNSPTLADLLKRVERLERSMAVQHGENQDVAQSHVNVDRGACLGGVFKSLLDFVHLRVPRRSQSQVLEERLQRLEFIGDARTHRAEDRDAVQRATTAPILQPGAFDSSAAATVGDGDGMASMTSKDGACDLEPTPPQRVSPCRPRRQLGRAQSAPEPPTLTAPEACCICLGAPRECAFTPCGHRCVCRVCGNFAVSTDRRCPICRVTATRVLRIIDP